MPDNWSDLHCVLCRCTIFAKSEKATRYFPVRWSVQSCTICNVIPVRRLTTYIVRSKVCLFIARAAIYPIDRQAYMGRYTVYSTHTSLWFTCYWIQNNPIHSFERSVNFQSIVLQHISEIFIRPFVSIYPVKNITHGWCEKITERFAINSRVNLDFKADPRERFFRYDLITAEDSSLCRKRSPRVFTEVSIPAAASTVFLRTRVYCFSRATTHNNCAPSRGRNLLEIITWLSRCDRVGWLT